MAILLTGSSASGNADFYSDIDMIAYYDAALPSEDQLQAARDDIGAESFRVSYPRWEDHTCGETYQVGGVECQVGHKVVADLEERTLSLLDGHDPADLGMNAIMGLLSGIPLHGDEIIEAWQARAANFSDRLARGMIEHYLREIFPLWYFAHMPEADTTILRYPPGQRQWPWQPGSLDDRVEPAEPTRAL